MTMTTTMKIMRVLQQDENFDETDGDRNSTHTHKYTAFHKYEKILIVSISSSSTYSITLSRHSVCLFCR